MPKQKKLSAAGASHQQLPHTPVMPKEVLELLKPVSGDSYLDLTAGAGGHATLVIALTASPSRAVLVDRDQQAVKNLKNKFASQGTQVIQQDFLAASQRLKNSGKKFNIILADLGISSMHIDQAERGFSFNRSGPLDMRMDTGQALTAGEIVNRWPLAKLAGLLRDYGEEPKSRAIAEAIVSARPIAGTSELALAVERVTHRTGKTHPATKTFQALRIAVNDELGQLSESLPLWLDLLEVGGRLAVISFHSLEDAIVKRFIAEHAGSGYEADLRILTKKPLTPGKDEIEINPRARSAKLRAAVKIKTKIERNREPPDANKGTEPVPSL